MLDPHPDQLPLLPVSLDPEALTEFLTALLSIQEEQDRLREVLTALKEQYKLRLPIRGILAAVKIERTAQKVETHPTEGMPRAHVEALRAWVQQFLAQRAAEVQALIDEATGETL